MPAVCEMYAKICNSRTATIHQTPCWLNKRGRSQRSADPVRTSYMCLVWSLSTNLREGERADDKGFSNGQNPNFRCDTMHAVFEGKSVVTCELCCTSPCRCLSWLARRLAGAWSVKNPCSSSTRLRPRNNLKKYLKRQHLESQGTFGMSVQGQSVGWPC